MESNFSLLESFESNAERGSWRRFAIEMSTRDWTLDAVQAIRKRFETREVEVCFYSEDVGPRTGSRGQCPRGNFVYEAARLNGAAKSPSVPVNPSADTMYWGRIGIIGTRKRPWHFFTIFKKSFALFARLVLRPAM